MNKILKSVMTAVASLALAVGFAVAPANAAVPSMQSRSVTSTVTSFSPSTGTSAFTAGMATINTYKFDGVTIGVTNAMSQSPWATLGTCPAFASRTTDLTLCGITSVKVGGVEDSSAWSAYVYAGPYTGIKIVRSSSFSNTDPSSSSLEITFASGAFTAGTSGGWVLRMDAIANGGSTTDQGTESITVTGGGGGGGGGGSVLPPSSPSVNTPAPTTPATSTAAATPTVGTAAALAELPKSTTAPKLKFDSSANGIGKSAKKSLKKVATVAKDGYGVRVTGAAGMQPGVSKDVVKKLAKKRALEIRDYLVKQGVNKEDIIIKTKIYPIGKAPATLVKIETLS